MRQIYQHIYLLGCTLFFLSVGCQKNGSSTVPVDHIYLNSNEFSYCALLTDSSSSLPTLDTVALVTTGNPWFIEPVQYEIGWKHTADIRTFSTGVLVRSDSIWMHPPRMGRYAKLEWNAFPCVHLNSKVGNSWFGNLFVPVSQWPALLAKTDEKIVQIKSKYTHVKDTLCTTPWGNEPVKIIEAETHSLMGDTQTTFYYSNTYGFVNMTFSTFDQELIKLKLMAINGISAL
jgi:hypothetical protein